MFAHPCDGLIQIEEEERIVMGGLENIEVELTFPLKNPDSVAEFLARHAIPEKREEYQKDTYFNAPHRNFLEKNPIQEWLRIRETAKNAILTYKYWHNEGNRPAVSCDEYETSVADPHALQTILERLDFRAVVVVEKRRSTWRYKDVEVALDNVTDLGSFIELEAKGEFRSIEGAKNHLYVVVKEIGAKTGEQDFRGYPHLLLQKQGKLLSR